MLPGEWDNPAFMAAIRTGAGRFGCPSTISIIEALSCRFTNSYGDDYQVECPTGSGTFLTLEGVARLAHSSPEPAFRERDDRTAAVLGDSRSAVGGCQLPRPPALQ